MRKFLVSMAAAALVAVPAATQAAKAHADYVEVGPTDCYVWARYPSVGIKLDLTIYFEDVESGGAGWHCPMLPD